MTKLIDKILPVDHITNPFWLGFWEVYRHIVWMCPLVIAVGYIVSMFV